MSLTSTLLCIIFLLALACIYFEILNILRGRNPMSLMVTPTPGVEHPEKVSESVLSICNVTFTSFCPPVEGLATWDPDSNCRSIASSVYGKEVACEDPNVCAFSTHDNENEYQQIYVSFKTKSSKAKDSSVTYKVCPNGLIIYSLE